MAASQDRPGDASRVLADLLKRIDRGDSFDLQEVLEKFPDEREEIESYFRAAGSLEQMLGNGPAPADKSPTFNARVPKIAGYELISEIGRGGMGVVYSATEVRLKRKVALKLLHPSLLEEEERMQRFRQEASITANLHESHVLPVYDVIVHEDCPVLVTPFVDGADLARIIEQRKLLKTGCVNENAHPWACLEDRLYTEKALYAISCLATAVAAIHHNNIIHRDIKPSNLLVDKRGNCWLIDFGLARLGQQSNITRHGAVLGTPGFISPEQYDGKSDLDERADIFAMGATAYQAATLELPYEAMVHRDSPLPVAPRKLNPLIGRGFETMILKSLAPDREQRYRSGQYFLNDWRRVDAGLPPHGSRPRPFTSGRRMVWMGVSMAIIGMLLIWYLFSHANQGQPHSGASGQPGLYVAVTTSPPANEGVLVPIDEETGLLSPERKVLLRPDGDTLVSTVRIAGGVYLLVVNADGHGFHEVFRTVPDQPDEVSGGFWHQRWTTIGTDTVELYPVKIPRLSTETISQKMCFLKGARDFVVGDNRFGQRSVGEHEREIQPYFLDTHVVSLGEYLTIKHARLQSAGLTGNEDPAGPAVLVSYDQAVEYAERIGKRLPDEAEFEFAATMAGTTSFPWGNSADSLTTDSFGKDAKADFDYTNTEPPIVGLFSGVAEWTTSWMLPYEPASDVVKQGARSIPEYHRLRIVRGGPSSVLRGDADVKEILRGPRWRHAVFASGRYDALGFRCARSAQPRFLRDR